MRKVTKHIVFTIYRPQLVLLYPTCRIGLPFHASHLKSTDAMLAVYSGNVHQDYELDIAMV